jgi:hypothetical protein
MRIQPRGSTKPGAQQDRRISEFLGKGFLAHRPSGVRGQLIQRFLQQREEGVAVLWADLPTQDAAEPWPADCKHGQLGDLLQGIRHRQARLLSSLADEHVEPEHVDEPLDLSWVAVQPGRHRLHDGPYLRIVVA